MSTWVVGFTGTRNGMTEQQKLKVGAILGLFSGPFIGLHGDCIGADADFDAICREMHAQDVLCRPCTYSGMRARTAAKEIAEPKTPMQRNRDIVADARMMIACPPNYERLKSGSGTWATIGFTEKAGKLLYVVYPDGTTKEVKPGEKVPAKLVSL